MIRHGSCFATTYNTVRDRERVYAKNCCSRKAGWKQWHNMSIS